ncbi:unnamed protein product [Brachionus calyciflorus]|uniref:GRIP domain-containing protein n=1 Tax=Brachionus calyciflorus TaxID=104777 RepID=A0A813WEI1_9BILA|nr:unnamed protein product [Brachionus calyciflorus]
MFKKLKSQIKESVTPVLNSGGSLLSSTLETVSNSARSRRDSHSSIASDTTGYLFSNYSTPSRNYYPPSDVESEVESDLNDSNQTNNESTRLNKLLEIYKQKFNQLKNAYNESEAEKEKIKKVLTDSQDKVLRRVQELKEQIEAEKLSKTQLETKYEAKLIEKDKLFETLKSQENQNTSVNLIDLESQNSTPSEGESKEKVEKLEILLRKCRELIKTQKQNLTEKEELCNTQQEKLAKLEATEALNLELTTKIQNLEKDLENSKRDFEGREINLNEEKSILQQNIDKLTKRCNDLNMELEEKGNLFQKQFQLFQTEFNEKEENLSYKLNLLQQDYNNLEQELINEKANRNKNDSINVPDELNAKINDIMNEKNQLETNYEAKIKELNEKLNQSESLNQDLVKENNDIETLNSELNELRTKITEIEDLKSKIENMNEELSKKTTEIDELRLKLSENNNLDELLRGKESQIEVLNQTINGLNSELGDLRSKLDSSVKSNEESKFKEENLHKEIEHLKEENKIIEQIRSKLAIKNEEVNILNQKIESYSNEVKQLNVKIGENSHSSSQRVEDLLKELETVKNEKDEIVKQKLSEIDSLKKELNEISSAKITLEKELNSKFENFQHNLKEKLEIEASLKEKISQFEHDKLILDKEMEDLKSKIKYHVDEIEARNIQIEEMKHESKILKDQFDSNEAKIIAEKEEYLEKNRQGYENKIENLTREFDEKLKNSQIDIDSLQNKLNESLKDYRSSIEKLQLASKQRLAKMKKKLVNCTTVLTLIDKNLFTLSSEEVDKSLLNQFVSSLTETKKQENESSEDTSFEFDENKFKQMIEIKKSQLEKLENLEKSNNEIDGLKELNEKLKQDLNDLENGFKATETKMKEEKDRAANEYQREIDELQLKIASLDLKNKQLLLEENRESHAIKKKVVTLQEELTRVNQEKAQLISQLKTDVETSEKNLVNFKKQADLRMASIKKQYENESHSKLEDINSKNYELELKLKEKTNLIEIFKAESDTFQSKLNQLEDELTKKFEAEKSTLKEEFENKIKHYEILLDEINNQKYESENDRLRDKDTLLSNLRKENDQLNQKLDDLKIAYDELVDEKANLQSNLIQLKVKNSSGDSNEIDRLNLLLKDRERVINELENKVTSKLLNRSVYEDSLGYTSTQSLKFNNSRSLMAESSDQDSLGSKTNLYNHCLESTEIDYLRQIIYSYMMGVDRVTMAKVIVAVLKFPDDERKKILENEKQRQANLFPNFLNR